MAALEAKYEVVLKCPARAATCSMVVVKAVPKDGSNATDIVQGQTCKLFIVRAPTPKERVCIHRMKFSANMSFLPKL